jgi:hypothetical protein
VFDDDCDEEDDGDGPAVTIIEERPPLREGMVFVDYGERAAISENLEAACVALNQAFRGSGLRRPWNTVTSANTETRRTSTRWRCPPLMRAAP